MAGQPKRAFSDAIVGAGFGGVGAAIRLVQAGITDITLFERSDGVGGVWHSNQYPGAACDVPSHVYSFSFAPGTQWSRHVGTPHDWEDYEKYKKEDDNRTD